MAGDELGELLLPCLEGVEGGGIGGGRGGDGIGDEGRSARTTKGERAAEEGNEGGPRERRGPEPVAPRPAGLMRGGGLGGGEHLSAEVNGRLAQGQGAQFVFELVHRGSL